MLLNLHSHLEGCVRPSTAADLARERGVAAPVGGWDASLQMRGRGDLTTFLTHVAAAYPVLGDPEAVARVAYEAVEDAAADGVAFLELRLGPATHVRPGFTVKDVLTAACAGARDASRATGVHVGVVACLLRHQAPPVHAEVTAAACELVGHGVTGIDLAGDELVFPSVQPYVRYFARARAAGLGITAHAAEAAAGSSARLAAELLGVQRIGHGSRAADDADVLRWAAEEGICFEVCPTSNVLTGAAASVRDHPVVQFLRSGCRVVLGDDDPTTTGVRLPEEAALLVQEGVLDQQLLERIAQDSVHVAFCDDGVRDDLRRRLAEERPGA